MRRVLNASQVLMAEGGFDAVQLATISKRTGVSTGSLYHHFGSKEGLITRIVDEFTTKAAADLEALNLDGLAFEQRLKCLLDLACAQFRNNPELYRSMSQRVKANPTIWIPLRELRAKFEERMLSELSKELRARGLYDPMAAIHRMMQTILGVLTHSVVFESGPIRPSDPQLETQIFAIGQAILLLPDQRGNPIDE